MISLFYFIRLAVQNLLHGGQRILVAVLCITFGIMALVSMNMVAQSIESAVILTPRQVIGGDISMGRKAEDTLRPQDIDQLNALQKAGTISDYTLIAHNDAIMFHRPGSGEMHFVGNGMGVEPENYPLAGFLTIGEPGSTGLATLLQKPGDVVVTRDIAGEYQLKVGDAIIVSDLHAGVPLHGVIRGIVYDTPNHQGDKIYYSLQTAQALANGQPAANTVILTTAQAKSAAAKLDSSGWSVSWVAEQGGRNTANLWVIGLRGAGILGLLVSGIGIANTMQVLLRRRLKEIAIWKTLGYRAGDLRMIFMFEAGLLGLAGSLLGAGLGVLISTGLLELFRRTSTLLYAWTFSWIPPLEGVLVGTITTVIFAAWAIVIYSQARPMALLRSEPVGDAVQGTDRILPGCQSGVLGLLLAGLFTALTGLVMQSAAAGIGVLAAILVGMALLGGFFKLLLSVTTRIFPLGGYPLVRMAFNNLRRRGPALVFAMIALFAGVISLSLGLVVAQVSNLRSAVGPVDIKDYNLTILAAADQESALRQAVSAQHPKKIAMGYRATIAAMRVIARDGTVQDVKGMDNVLVGRADPQDFILSGNTALNFASSNPPEGVYAYQLSNLKAGSQVGVTFRDGTRKTFPVLGTYTIYYHSNNLYPSLGLLMSAETFQKVVKPDALTCFVQLDAIQINTAAAVLGEQLPQATVVNLADYAGRFMRSYQNLFVLAIAMAGLAFLAGILLVANSASLTMLDRRYEIGILKSVGYSRSWVLSIFVVEYGWVGVLATGTGLLVIEGLLWVLGAVTHHMGVVLLLNPASLALIVFSGVGLTLLAVLGVAWNATGVSPITILNEGK